MSESSHVLIIEDNDFVRLQIAKFLGDAGYVVHQASGASEGMDILYGAKDKIAVLLVDIRMEPIDGWGFVMRMQAENIHKPVILVTGDENNDILARASQMGVASVLMKPVNKDRLIKMVERIIANSKHES